MRIRFLDGRINWTAIGVWAFVALLYVSAIWLMLRYVRHGHL